MVFQVRCLPSVDAPTLRFGNGGFDRRALHFDGPVPGHADLKLLIQQDGLVLEIVVVPELPWRQRLGSVPANLVFKHIAGTKSLHGCMFFPQVAIKWRFARDAGIHILDIVRGSHDDRPVRFAHPQILHFDRLRCALIRERQQAIALYARVGLDARPERKLLCRGAIVFKVGLEGEELPYSCFPGIVANRRSRAGRSLG
jgi:hypothetical protein